MTKKSGIWAYNPDLENADGSSCTLDERAEFALAVMKDIYASKLETQVKAGRTDLAAESEFLVATLKKAEENYKKAVASGRSKVVASAELFKAFNAIDDAYGTSRTRSAAPTVPQGQPAFECSRRRRKKAVLPSAVAQ